MLSATSALARLLGTLAILAFIPGGFAKLIAFIAWWTLTLPGVAWRELVAVAVVCSTFTIMNSFALKAGIFAFRSHDVLGMPAYEPFMWGFYSIHTWRTLRSPPSAPFPWPACILACMFAGAFAIFSDPDVLLVSSGAIVAVGLAIYRQPADYMYVAYMIAVGAAIEYTGVWSGQWFYPTPPVGGVPLWFIPLWGGVGLWLRRLVVPFVFTRELPGGPENGEERATSFNHER